MANNDAITAQPSRRALLGGLVALPATTALSAMSVGKPALARIIADAEAAWSQLNALNTTTSDMDAE